MADKGADEFFRLSKALKESGQKEVRKQLHKGMRDAAKPLVAEAKKAAAEAPIPARGGLRARIARTTFRAQVRTGATTAGVRITAPGKFVTVKLLNRYGRVRHPVHADPSKTRREWAWVNQEVPEAKGWFDDAMREHAPEVRDDVVKAMRAVPARIARAAK